MILDLIENELTKPTLFKDETKLSFHYLPSKLIHREKEIKLLARIFKPLVDKPGNFTKIALIYGDPGTGKTAVSKLFGRMIEESAKVRKINLKYIHINCAYERTLFLILLRIAKALNSKIPKRGFSPSELLQIINEILEKENIFALICLDEVECAVDAPDLVYTFLKLVEAKTELNRISLILISRKPIIEFMPLNLANLIYSIEFRNYTNLEIKDIIKIRVQEAFYPSTIAPGVIDYIADIITETSDIRYGLELLWRAGKYADEEGQVKIYPEHVRMAQHEIIPQISVEHLNALNKTQKLLLLAIITGLQTRQKPYIPIGEVEKTYREICVKYGIKPRKHTQVWEYVKTLNKLGIINTQISKDGVRGRTTLVNLTAVSPSALKSMVLRSLEGLKNE
ncbi:MAG: ORC1-type DNA replication protein [Candidatus Odinarchaeia archaeon]